jgi:hypothetical protein
LWLPVVELLLELPFDDAALFFDDDDLFETLRELPKQDLNR